VTQDLSGYRFQPATFDAAEWDARICAAPGRNLIQTWAYGEAKQASGPWRAERGLITGPDGQPVGAAQVLLRRLRFVGDAMAWVNRGPLCLDAVAAPPELEAGLIAAVARHYAGERGLYLRLAPMAEEAAFDAGLAAAAGLEATGTLGWASATLDLTRPLDDLRAGLHGKWRNALTRAEKAGLEVRLGDGDELFERFIVGHRAHIKRLGPEGGLDEWLLRALRKAQPAGKGFLALLAMVDGRAVAGMIFVRFGDTAEYLAGHADDKGRTENAGQLLLWSVMARLKEEGLSRLDLGGMDEKLTPEGIYRFKARVGAQPYRLAGELESRPGSLLGRLIRARVRRARASA
jgi:lipid II:glycine glycyltransferase (peptidoglycan interpeptide bridge formation enzyme)